MATRGPSTRPPTPTFIINSCASTCAAIGCGAGSRMGAFLENRYSAEWGGSS